jgi:hypothetical protein
MYKNCTYTPKAIQASGFAIADIEALDYDLWDDYTMWDDCFRQPVAPDSHTLTFVAQLLLYKHWQHFREPHYYTLFWDGLQTLARNNNIPTEAALMASLDMPLLTKLRATLDTMLLVEDLRDHLDTRLN